jgi:predicted NUDIX family phosphoesterase
LEGQILVVPRSKLFENIDPPDGFGTKDVETFLETIRSKHEFANRKEAENRPDLKQIIPYILVAHIPPDKPDKHIFLMKRSTLQDEERLRDLYSIGVGGHLNPQLDSAEDPVTSGLTRELNEELVITADYRLKLIGYINDESNPVGQVHFGLAYTAFVQTPEVEVREKDLMSGAFATLSEAESVYPEMETWSQIVFRNIDAFLK